MVDLKPILLVVTNLSRNDIFHSPMVSNGLIMQRA